MKNRKEGIMKIVIVGAGVVGEEICTELSEGSNSHDVILIEKDAERLEKIIESNDITGLVGNGANYENLMEAGVDKADIFINQPLNNRVHMCGILYLLHFCKH